MDDSEISKPVEQANLTRGGKPAKYPHLDKYPEIVTLIENNVQLPFILKWLLDQKGEKLALNTLRKYVVFKMGRAAYEAFLKRNGWLKTKRNLATPKSAATAEALPEARKNSGLDFNLDFPKPPSFKRTLDSDSGDNS